MAKAKMVPATDAPVNDDDSTTPAKAPKKAAKKVPAKGKATKGKAKAPAERFTPAQVKLFDNAFAEWKKGARIADLAAPLIKSGLITRRGSLRRQLRKRAGGKEAFVSLRQVGAGGVRESLGARPKDIAQDKNATVIPVGGRDGWKHRVARVEGGEPQMVHVAGKGIEYVAATATQKADALAQMGNGLPPMRLVKFTQPAPVTMKA